MKPLNMVSFQEISRNSLSILFEIEEAPLESGLYYRLNGEGVNLPIQLPHAIFRYLA